MHPDVTVTGVRTAEGGARAPGGARLLTRRSAGLILLGVVPAVTATVLQVRPFQGQDAKGPGDETFDETYLGRRITGIRVPGATAGGGGTWQVAVDGRPLHLMRRADGSYLSMVDHYASYPTPLDAARGAVRELGTQELRSPDREV
ncbi:tyrosinase family oxidase copper chaperone [Streptomyces sp. VRA16 Mangrove soil]|uniref:tyrosinase family oxidase copper chaperone n=1 Tax=Streptomyces sp. VRA16 Mangrove soil TaxID=2817434 RepID=UPI0035ABA37B